MTYLTQKQIDELRDAASYGEYHGIPPELFDMAEDCLNMQAPGVNLVYKRVTDLENEILDLLDRLRGLSRHEHSDLSVGDEAADILARLLIGTLNRRCRGVERTGPEAIEQIFRDVIDAAPKSD